MVGREDLRVRCDNDPTNLLRPAGMNRRHFLQHLAGASAMTLPAFSLTHSLQLRG